MPNIKPTSRLLLFNSSCPLEAFMYASAAAFVLGPLMPSITPGLKPALLSNVCASEILLVVVVTTVSSSSPSVNLIGSPTSSNFSFTSS